MRSGGDQCDCEQHNLTVIEDAAHALGATYKGQAVGNISRFTAFSFQAIKHLTTGDGGMLCCASEEDAKQAVIGRWFGIDRANMQKTPEGRAGLRRVHIGLQIPHEQYRGSSGLGQFNGFSVPTGASARNRAMYRTHLNNIPGIELLHFAPDREHAYWLFTSAGGAPGRFRAQIGLK